MSHTYRFSDTQNTAMNWMNAHQQKECCQHWATATTQLHHGSSHLDGQIEQKHGIRAENYNIPYTNTVSVHDTELINTASQLKRFVTNTLTLCDIFKQACHDRCQM